MLFYNRQTLFDCLIPYTLFIFLCVVVKPIHLMCMLYIYRFNCGKLLELKWTFAHITPYIFLLTYGISVF